MASPTTGNDPQVVKVASYNIRKAVGTDRRRDPLRVLRVLSEINADVIALQEADRRFGERISALPAAMIRDHSDYVPVPLGPRQDSLGWHGNALLVKNGIEVEHSDIVHLPFLEPRGAVRATVRIGSANLTVFGMHLDLSGLYRRRQIQAIAAMADNARSQNPAVLMGDLNEWRVKAGSLREFGPSFDVLDCGRSFHSRRPMASLDRIMHCDRLSPRAQGVHHSALAKMASDHLPVWAELAIAEGGNG